MTPTYDAEEGQGLEGFDFLDDDGRCRRLEYDAGEIIYLCRPFDIDTFRNAGEKGDVHHVEGINRLHALSKPPQL